MDDERRAHDRAIIAEFRARGGAIGDPRAGRVLGLLHHRGAKTGRSYVTPLTCLRDDNRWLVAAGNGGRPEYPGWYHNLLADPEVAVEIGVVAHPVRARPARGEEWERYAARFRVELPVFAVFEAAVTRDIPIFVLEPR
ncbi:nitroreductase/quinone reductase family protein [Saccharothrix obliqua]|uniref:nitroreductase/quinone reductase family protein n=1 Tax=Saccharothrix obliqua TaxID=2861747 RepID=UPI001C5CD0C5|nr:nitroreductase/quinone reductase family protein [Saccharothrix obliqua]MBW4718341.1 nitroreductase family deazaflavin-dependent oxidoreductase [Saccharothrix obliqua]